MDTVKLADHPDIKHAIELKRGTDDVVYLVLVELKSDADVATVESTTQRANALAMMLTSLNVCALVLTVKDTMIRVIDVKRTVPQS